eukprot:1701047-Pleurochrysis_carterae.AAC.4
MAQQTSSRKLGSSSSGRLTAGHLGGGATSLTAAAVSEQHAVDHWKAMQTIVERLENTAGAYERSAGEAHARLSVSPTSFLYVCVAVSIVSCAPASVAVPVMLGVSVAVIILLLCLQTVPPPPPPCLCAFV